MSSRALRKANNRSLEDELAKYTSPSPEVEESSEDERPARTVNAFAFLGDDDEDEAEEDQPKEEEEAVENPESGAEEAADSEQVMTAPSVKKTGKKKSKKAKKKKKTNSKKIVNEEDEEGKSDDDLDRILKELEIKEDRVILEKPLEEEDIDSELEDNDRVEVLDDAYQFFTLNKFSKSLKYLKVMPRDLDPDSEFKALFGDELSSKAIADADSSSSSFVSPEALAFFKDLAKKVKNWGGRDRRTVPRSNRKLTFTKIRDDWMPTNIKFADMEELGKSKITELIGAKTQDWKEVIAEDIRKEQKMGIRYYRYYANMGYKEQNSRFFIAVAMAPDPESLFHILQRTPYHVESLLQASSILLHQGDKSNSSALVERALFVFDWALKQNFEIGTGLMRLPFEYFMNRQFYLAMFRYIQVLTAKSTFYTALQYCIFMLSLNPTEDPYGVRYFIDFYAIMAGEYDYLVAFSESPLATTYTAWLTPSLAYSKVLALLRSDFEANKERAKAALEQAFKLYPYTGTRLLEEVGVSGTSAAAFAKDVPLYDQVATEAYIVRAKVMWASEESSKATGFLRSELLRLTDESPRQKDGIFSYISSFFGKASGDSDGQDVPVNLLRHVILSGESKVMAKLPASFWDTHKEELLEFDVLPPRNGASESFEEYIDPKIISAIVSESQADEAYMQAVMQSLEENQRALVDQDGDEE